MALDTLPILSGSVQQHARNLHSQLSQALSGTSDADTTSNTAEPELRQLVACNARLARALASRQAPAAAEDAEELQAACYQRQELLQELLQSLDGSVLGLRAQLDACHKLLRTPPCKEAPEDIIRCAHTLRHGFAPLGTAPGLPPVPPAPQIPFMLHSTLRMYHMDLAQQQQQQQTVQQPQQLPPVPSLQQQQQPAAAAAAAAAGVQQPASEAALPAAVPEAAPVSQVMQFRLNADLDDDEFDPGETASESGYDEEEDDTESD